MQLPGLQKAWRKPKDTKQQRTPATTQWPRNRKSHLFAISNPNVLCLVILLFCQSNLVSSRLPNYQYHVDSLVDTRKALLSYFAGKAGGCWILACTEYAARTQLL